MPGKPTRTACEVTCLLESVFRGRRLSRRLLRGGAFNNQPSNVRSANRNNNQPDNRNNNNGFRVASTLRQDSFSAMPEFAGGLWTSCAVCECKVQVVVPCRAGCVQSGRINSRPGRSGRSQDSNALPGHFVALIAVLNLGYDTVRQCHQI